MKNRSSLLIIFALCILCGISFYLFKTKTTASTLDKEASDFAIKDTSEITKIFLADKEGHKVTLERTQQGWILNGKYPCRPDAISTLLYTINMVDVKSPVAKTAKDNVLKLMSAKSIKCEIYHGNTKIKQYYVGHENLDNDGTYMVLTNLDTEENYEDPFLTYIPGFNGFLSSRYITKESDWRDRLIINYTPLQLKSIKVEHAEIKDSSFVIDVIDTKTFALKKADDTPLTFDEMKMKQYLAYFQNVNYETLITTSAKTLSDSIRNAVPYITLTITDTQNQSKVFTFTHKNSTEAINRKYGMNYKYDPDRFYLRFDNDKEVALVQFFVFGKILPTYGYFLPKSTVKK